MAEAHYGESLGFLSGEIQTVKIIIDERVKVYVDLSPSRILALDREPPGTT